MKDFAIVFLLDWETIECHLHGLQGHCLDCIVTNWIHPQTFQQYTGRKTTK